MMCLNHCLDYILYAVCAVCAVPPDAKTVVLAVMGSILLVGIILLAAWKLVITIHDRREFARFQSARSRARYEMVKTFLSSCNTRMALC